MLHYCQAWELSPIVMEGIWSLLFVVLCVSVCLGCISSKTAEFGWNFPHRWRSVPGSVSQFGGNRPREIFKILIFGDVTVMEFLICCCVPNFIKIGSCIWRPHHDGHVGDAMGCDHPSFLHIGPMGGELYSISNIFKYGSHPPAWLWILSFWTTHEIHYVVRLPWQNLVSV